jgi:hypothetical protein
MSLGDAIFAIPDAISEAVCTLAEQRLNEKQRAGVGFVLNWSAWVHVTFVQYKLARTRR